MVLADEFRDGNMPGQMDPLSCARAAKPKRLRFEIFNVTGRFVRDRRKISLRLDAPEPWIRSLMKLFETYPLATQSTG